MSGFTAYVANNWAIQLENRFSTGPLTVAPYDAQNDYQLFKFDSGFLVPKLNPDYTLDVTGQQDQAGTEIGVWTINTAQPANQQWSLDADGYISSTLSKNNGSNLVLTINPTTKKVELQPRSATNSYQIFNKSPPLAAPILLHTYDYPDKLTLHWSYPGDESRVSSYTIYQTSPVTQTHPVGKSYSKEFTVTITDTYSFIVKAKAADNTEGDPSNVDTFLSPASTSMPMYTLNLSATPNEKDAEVRLDWTVNSGAVYPSILSYTVQQQEPTQQVTEVSAQTFTTSVVPGVRYVFVIYANTANKIGAGHSNTIDITVPHGQENRTFLISNQTDAKASLKNNITVLDVLEPFELRRITYPKGRLRNIDYQNAFDDFTATRVVDHNIPHLAITLTPPQRKDVTITFTNTTSVVAKVYLSTLRDVIPPNALVLDGYTMLELKEIRPGESVKVLGYEGWVYYFTDLLNKPVVGAADANGNPLVNSGQNRYAVPKSVDYDATTVRLVELGSLGRFELSWLPGKRFELLYKATRDGFGAAQFHAKANNKGATLTIVTSESGHMFGGYTTESWAGTGYKYANGTFIFTLTNPHNIPPTRYFSAANNSYAIYTNNTYGPTFGNGHDLYIANNSNAVVSSYARPYTGYIYTGPTFDRKTFTGSDSFKVKEIEVYQVL